MKKSDKSKLELAFGALVPDLDEQLKNQGITKLGRPQFITEFQNDADAITRLGLRGLLVDSEKDKARKRLLGKIVEYLEKG